jgi:hypothetical protein
VSSAAASIDLIARRFDRTTDAVDSSSRRSRVALTSPEVSSSPFWNVTSGRSVKVSVRPSSEVAHSLAKAGCSAPVESTDNRLS